MKRTVRWRVAGLAALCLAASGATCGPTSTLPPSVAETMVQMGDELVNLREEHAILQAQIDSLGLVVARQDTLLRRVAGMAGVPVGTP
ncbi:MAG TPA: hypothetical protein VFK13_06015 [Gemmatimonadaceae bacterium]|nr:hypothetical protein [Gemmatimonadaceae bacterium]